MAAAMAIKKAASGGDQIEFVLPRKWWEEDLSSLAPWEIPSNGRDTLLDGFKKQVNKHRQIRIACDDRDWHYIVDELAKYVVRRSDELQSEIGNPGLMYARRGSKLERRLNTIDYGRLKRLERFKRDASAKLDETLERRGPMHFIGWAQIDCGGAWSTFIVSLANYFRRKGLEPKPFGNFSRRAHLNWGADLTPFLWLAHKTTEMIPKELRQYTTSPDALRKQIEKVLDANPDLD
jgi:hypothetical protein